MDWITQPLTSLLGIAGQIIDLVTSNGVLSFIFVGTTIVPIALGVYHGLKRN